ncbi:MAG: hypothetical protein IJK28_00440, partial [Clostridia bacterium]|nr:hypothetical protein [Clostridia bacterium]
AGAPEGFPIALWTPSGPSRQERLWQCKVSLINIALQNAKLERVDPEGSRDSERPENCPGDSFQRRMGGSPGPIGKPLARSAEREPSPLPHGFPELSVKNRFFSDSKRLQLPSMISQ